MLGLLTIAVGVTIERTCRMNASKSSGIGAGQICNRLPRATPSPPWHASAAGPTHSAIATRIELVLHPDLILG